VSEPSVCVCVATTCLGTMLVGTMCGGTKCVGTMLVGTISVRTMCGRDHTSVLVPCVLYTGKISVGAMSLGTKRPA
jgi:hypothetical protein